jgi:hypothetical protein
MRLKELSPAFACVEHAGLHGVFLDPNDLGDLIDGLVVVVDEIDRFPVVGRNG